MSTTVAIGSSFAGRSRAGYVDVDDQRDPIGKRTAEGALTGALAGALFGPPGFPTRATDRSPIAAEMATSFPWPKLIVSDIISRAAV